MIANPPRPKIVLRDYAHEVAVAGKVGHLFCARDSFSAGVLNADSGPMFDRDVKFSVPAQVHADEEIILRGAWTHHSKYGWQFAATSLEYPMPDTTSAAGLAEYLANCPAFKGIGPSKARLIAEAFGENFDAVIRDNPAMVATAGKLTLTQADALRSVWMERADLNAVSQWLAGYGLTHNQIKKIATKYGNRARQVLIENPYILCDDIDGFGFSRTDEIALKMGTTKEHPGRIRSCLVHLVKQEAEDGGHTWIERGALVKSAVAKLAFDTLRAEALIREQLTALCAAGEFGEEAPLIAVEGEERQ